MCNLLKAFARKSGSAILCAIGFFIPTSSAMGLDFTFDGGNFFFQSEFDGPDGVGCLAVSSLSLNGSLQVGMVRVNNAAGGNIYSNGDVNIRNPISVADLEACGYLDVDLVAQDGANFASVDLDNEMSVTWRSREAEGRKQTFAADASRTAPWMIERTFTRPTASQKYLLC